MPQQSGTHQVTVHIPGLATQNRKIEGPATVLVFLGIILDTASQELCLPQEKVEELSRLVKEWKDKRVSIKCELLSLIGKLSHATKVVVSGRTFLRRMIDTAASVQRLDHHIKLRAVSIRWECFLPIWNTRSLMHVHAQKRGGTSDSLPYRCLRQLGMQRHLGKTMVPIPMAFYLVAKKHCCKRTIADCPGLCAMGSTMGS